MKNLTLLTSIFLVISFCILSCKQDDDDNNQKINPPVWIQGNWVQKNTVKYRFKSNDFITVDSGGKEYSFTTYLRRGTISVITSSDNEYNIQFKGTLYQSGTTTTNGNIPNSGIQTQENFSFHFKKMNETTMTDMQGVVYQKLP